MRFFQVAILGSSEASEEEKKVAYEAGKFIGENKWVLINGGRSGVMEASAKGCSSVNGISVGILPSANFEEGNKYLSIVIPTSIGFSRNVITAISGDIAVIVGGSSGTLTELAYAWNYGKKIICCSWLDGVSREYANKKLDYRRNYYIESVENLEELKKILKLEYNKWVNFK